MKKEENIRLLTHKKAPSPPGKVLETRKRTPQEEKGARKCLLMQWEGGGGGGGEVKLYEHKLHGKRVPKDETG